VPLEAPGHASCLLFPADWQAAPWWALPALAPLPTSSTKKGLHRYSLDANPSYPCGAQQANDCREGLTCDTVAGGMGPVCGAPSWGGRRGVRWGAPSTL